MNRREFLHCTTIAGLTTAGTARSPWLAFGADGSTPVSLPPIAVFSKVYQELKLDYDESAEVTAEAGLNGIDCPVRPGGQVAPERATEELPQYAKALQKRGVKILLLTTGITSVDTPHARQILTAAKKLGVRFYRLGYWYPQKDVERASQLREIRAQLEDLVAMNRELGVTALFQNHSADAKAGTGPIGGNLDELAGLIKDLDADQLAVAFDPGHAIITHGDGWRQRFDKVRSSVRVAYLKDVRRPASFVRFGEGEFAKSGFMPLWKPINHDAPLCVHIEYPWAPDGQKTRQALIDTLKHSRHMVARWWSEA